LSRVRYGRQGRWGGLSWTQSAKLQGKNPFVYLKDVRVRLPSAKAKDLDALPSHNWQSA
jgi:hypothetical protein